MNPIDRIEGWVLRRETFCRRLSAVIVAGWLVGWVPAILFTDNWPGRYGPQIYAWWIILIPLFGLTALAAGIGLWVFFWWALEPAAGESVQERIARLERELDIR